MRIRPSPTHEMRTRIQYAPGVFSFFSYSFHLFYVSSIHFARHGIPIKNFAPKYIYFQQAIDIYKIYINKDKHKLRVRAFAYELTMENFQFHKNQNKHKRTRTNRSSQFFSESSV